MPIEAIRMSNVKSQSMNKISFKGEEVKPQVPADVKTEDTFEKKGMSSSTKYMIGGGSIIALAALGILGYKGKLGESIQKLLGGLKDAADDAGKKVGDAIDNAGKKVEDAVDGATNAGKKNVNDKVVITLESIADDVTKLGEIKESKKMSEAIKGIFDNIEQLPEKDQEKAVKSFMDITDDMPSETIALFGEKDAEIFAKKAFPYIKKTDAAKNLTEEQLVNSIKESVKKAQDKVAQKASGTGTPIVKATLESVTEDIQKLGEIKESKKMSEAIKGIFENIEQLPKKKQAAAIKNLQESFVTLPDEVSLLFSDADCNLMAEKTYSFIKVEKGTTKPTLEEYRTAMLKILNETKAKISAEQVAK